MSAAVKAAPLVSKGVAGTLEGSMTYTFRGRSPVARSSQDTPAAPHTFTIS